jgi:hypothetical protein
MILKITLINRYHEHDVSDVGESIPGIPDYLVFMGSIFYSKIKNL